MVLRCCVKHYRATVSDWFVLMIIISSQSSHWLLLVVWIYDNWLDLDVLFVFCWAIQEFIPVMGLSREQPELCAATARRERPLFLFGQQTTHSASMAEVASSVGYLHM